MTLQMQIRVIYSFCTWLMWKKLCIPRWSGQWKGTTLYTCPVHRSPNAIVYTNANSVNATPCDIVPCLARAWIQLSGKTSPCKKSSNKINPSRQATESHQTFCKHLGDDPCLAISWGPADHLTVENVLYPKRIEEAGDRQSPETVTSEIRIRNQDE